MDLFTGNFQKNQSMRKFKSYLVQGCDFSSLY